VRRAGSATELRLVVTVPDFEDALAFFRDGLGLRERASVSSPAGSVAILDAGRATLELADAAHATHVDEVAVGSRTAGVARVAFEVADAVAETQALQRAGARLLAPPTPTPWRSLNSRLVGPASLQLTLFSTADVST
jgi:lactoylglutathione lyase